jgi:hypothetical protein
MQVYILVLLYYCENETHITHDKTYNGMSADSQYNLRKKNSINCQIISISI